MKDKQPQTCYVEAQGSEWNEKYLLDNIRNRDGIMMRLNQLTDCYIFTKEQLEERDIEKHNFYMQEAIRAKSEAEMYKRQYENFVTPFQKEGTF